MKKLLIIIGIAILFLSCEKEDQACNCDAKFTDGIQPGYYIVTKQPIDCNTGQPINTKNNHFFLGCK